jgi:hypothetical protein
LEQVFIRLEQPLRLVDQQLLPAWTSLATNSQAELAVGDEGK